MQKLSRDAFARARSYIFAQGRPLEQTLFAYHFEAGPANAVLEALASYQNEDGGFGHALEADLRLGASSALATTVAFQVLREMRAGPEQPLVRGGIEYLLATYNAAEQVWPIIPPEADSAPRAPWWNYAESAATFGQFKANPRAEIVGYFYDYAALVPTDLLHQLTESLVDHLASLPDEKMESFDLLCYLRLAQSPGLASSVAGSILDKLRRAAPHTVSQDKEQWSGYATRPLWLAVEPEAPLAAVLDDILPVNLDYEIEHQDADGSWGPPWSWGQYPDEWAVAEREWRGALTLDTLLALRAFGRLED